ncbi:adenylosuccinate lyase [Spiroplasma sabaudiense Ar-1343]|uniref:Adenylosuccinate lyase n=1 Tax=Spiroplasma sabaudiense Ar-1343 TaxID=1276257 RepID=W6ABN2_9MOLU|nr:adenylosuccinate lyase [Spiroplasma sabaudiense]AHI54235.1 adenylosuccinate lyase [Spiroplasma sabaudiense Ar-1343]
MIDRYKVNEIEKIWSETNKLETWLLVENKVTLGWCELKVIPKSDCEKIIKNARVNYKRMQEIEIQTKHDVVAFTRMLSESLGEEKKWIHLGLTSTDVVDTAQNYLIANSNKVLMKSLDNLTAILKEKAIANKKTMIMGRTHGIYGEPTSLGLKFLLWYEEINRQVERLNLARNQIEVAKVSGSMGNYANLELELEEFVAKELNLGTDTISTQVTQRDRHAFLVSVFANIASTIEKIAIEIRSFQRSEVQEMMEGFAVGQKGSSSMPHKKNPISSENISGLARYIRTFVSMSLENNLLWHERDISHSSNERIMFPDIYHALIYSLNRLTSTIKDLYINPKQMMKHIEEQKNIFFSQPILTYIIKNTNYSREEIYDFIQECTLRCQANASDFKDELVKNNINKYIKENEFEKMFHLDYFLRNVEKVYEGILKNGRSN